MAGSGSPTTTPTGTTPLSSALPLTAASHAGRAVLAYLTDLLPDNRDVLDPDATLARIETLADAVVPGLVAAATDPARHRRGFEAARSARRGGRCERRPLPLGSRRAADPVPAGQPTGGPAVPLTQTNLVLEWPHATDLQGWPATDVAHNRCTPSLRPGVATRQSS